MSIAAFFIAWYLLVRREPDQPGVLRYIGAAVLFFASYTTASLLPFTALPVAHHVFLVVRSKGLSRSVVGQFFARWWYVLAAPIAFWTIRTLFLQPYGLYLNYNQLTSFGLLPRFVRLGLVGLSVTLLGACLVLIYLFVSRHRSRRTVGRTVSLGILVLAIAGIAFYLEMTVGTASPLAQIVPAVLALSAAVLVAFAAREVASRLRGNSEPQPDAAGSASVIPTAAVGLIAFALGVLPYLLVGKVPTFGTWETRHQLLMPIGIAIIILAALRALNAFVPASPVRVASLALVCVFCAASFSASLALVTDWRKQMQITAELRNEPLVRDASTVVFIDLAPSLNYDSRPYSFYEYTGWMSTAFGNQKRIGVDPTSIGTLLDGGFVGAEDVASRYGFGEWTPSADGVKVEIVPVENASWWTLLIGEKSVTLRVTPIPELDSVR